MQKILIVDDEEILRMLIRDTLEDSSYILDEAENGQEALDKLLNEDYDLVLLDNMMPVLTGIEVLEKLPADRKESMEILVLTAKAQKQDQEAIFEAGAHYFMAKPFSPMELLRIVEEILG